MNIKIEHHKSTRRMSRCNGRCLKKVVCTFDADLATHCGDHPPMCLCENHDGQGSPYNITYPAECCEPHPCRNWELCRRCEPQYLLDMKCGWCVRCSIWFAGDSPPAKMIFEDSTKCQVCGDGNIPTVNGDCHHNVCICCLRGQYLSYFEVFDFNPDTPCLRCSYVNDIDDIDDVPGAHR